MQPTDDVGTQSTAGQRHMNAVDATRAQCARSSDAPFLDGYRGALTVLPSCGRRAGPSVSGCRTSKFWGVSWDKRARRWQAQYTDANGKTRHIGFFDTQESAAHATARSAIRALPPTSNHDRADEPGRRRALPARRARGADAMFGCDALRKRPRGRGSPPRRHAGRRAAPAGFSRPRTKRRFRRWLFGSLVMRIN